MAILWLDDVRDPARHGYAGAVWAKTYLEAILALKTRTISKASLDHDLSIEQTLGFEDKMPTGYDVVVWLCQNPEYWPPLGVRVHSANPVGRARMEKLIEDFVAGRNPFL